MKRFIPLLALPLAWCTPDNPGRGGGPRVPPTPNDSGSFCRTLPDGSTYCRINDSGMGPPIKPH
jgi:hypothetical protein